MTTRSQGQREKDRDRRERKTETGERKRGGWGWGQTEGAFFPKSGTPLGGTSSLTAVAPLFSSLLPGQGPPNKGANKKPSRVYAPPTSSGLPLAVSGTRSSSSLPLRPALVSASTWRPWGTELDVMEAGHGTPGQGPRGLKTKSWVVRSSGAFMPLCRVPLMANWVCSWHDIHLYSHMSLQIFLGAGQLGSSSRFSTQGPWASHITFLLLIFVMYEMEVEKWK